MYRELSYVVLAGLVLAGVERVDAQELGKGNILFEYWWDGGIGGNLDTIRNHPDFPDKPGASEWWQSMSRADLPYTNRFGARARGYLTPPQTGDYTFWVYGDDDGELYLSTDDRPINSMLVAETSGWTAANDWYKSGTQKSSPRPLMAGQRYYIEALYVDDIEAGLVGAGWSGPGIGADPVVIDGKYLSPFIRTPEPLLQAQTPVPAPGAVDVVNPVLTWTASAAAFMHEVYLGTHPVLGPVDYKDRKTDAAYFPTQPLTPGTTYYWRVDEVDAAGTKHVGDVWSFTVMPLTAHQPIPSNGDSAYLYTDRKVLLAWTAGFSAVRHHVYFGQSDSDVAKGTGATDMGSQAGTNFMAGPLIPGTTYYWRVDEVLANKMVAPGQLWRFKTVNMRVRPGMGSSDDSENNHSDISIVAAPTPRVDLNGYLRDAVTGNEIEGAGRGKVSLLPGPLSKVTYPDGYYWIQPVKGAMYNVNVEANGYVAPPTFQLTLYSDTAWDFLLQPTVGPDPPLTCPVYGFRSLDGSKCFFTANESDRDKLLSLANDWIYKGVVFCTADKGGVKDVHHFRHDWKNTHFYTIKDDEKNYLIANFSVAWKYEGVAFRAYDTPVGGTSPVYRFWSDTLERHFYTICEAERREKEANRNVWTPESIAWYAFGCMDNCN